MYSNNSNSTDGYATSTSVKRAFELLDRIAAAGRLHLGLKLIELAGALLGSDDLGTVADPILKQLVAVTGETVHLGRPAGGELVYIAKVESPQSVRLVSRIGARVPMYCSAMGKAVLAALDDEAREAQLAGPRDARTKRTIVAEAKLREEIARVRAQGYAIDNEVIEVENPATGEVLGSVAAATPQQVADAIAAAQEGQRAMATLPSHGRAELLQRAADGIASRHEELARLLASENGKPILQTREEVAAAIRIFRGFAEESKRLFGRQVPLDAVPGLESHLAFTIREPLGVVAAIVPFNYPVELYAHKAAAALAAGNAVLVKPPEKCPLTLVEVAGIVAEAGAPPAAHQVVHGGPEVAQALARSEGVQLISITGSTAAGRLISELAAQSLKRVHLELGGNDPMIVCADADVEKAADAVVLGRLARGNGQICCAVKRVYAERPVYDELAEALP